jgi:hypothetical protein
MTAPIPLDGLFFRLVREGFPLGIRDLNEALCALEAGFGTGNRENLMWLCRALWARTEEEDRRIGILFQQHLPRPTAEEVAALTGRLLPEQPPETDTAACEDPAAHELPNQRANTPALEISGAEQPGGIGLPRAAVAASRAESFILAPKPLVSLRSCVIAWRRYRRPIRSGPKVELDLEQTIAAKAAKGFLPAPVLVSRRGNQARVVCLSIPDHDGELGTPPRCWWNRFASRLGVSAVFYFHEAPDRLFERPDSPARCRCVRARPIPGNSCSSGERRRKRARRL